MTPVISPWVFYLMPLCDGVAFFCDIFGTLSLFATIGVIIAYISETNSDYKDESTLNTLKSIKKLLIPITCVLIIGSVFLPTEKTITKMVIAQNVTYERVETVTDTVETVYNDIMDLFEEG